MYSLNSQLVKIFKLADDYVTKLRQNLIAFTISKSEKGRALLFLKNKSYQKIN